MTETYFSPTFSDHGGVVARTVGGTTSEDFESNGLTARLKMGSGATGSGSNPSRTGVED
jgi:hypothetical protein